ncbi:MAG TPA: cobyrinate a,c-diamide synthase [Thiobacillaceae bacterium]|nr:cobyrinate a,c-diamide synthase [Thiobacillaceae bacterium]
MISAAHKSSGKTTLAIGLCAALRGRGLVVQSFKKGPDYIDPMWLSRASGRACRNLDFYLMGHGEIRDSFELRASDADVALIEGNKGLYDGLHLDGSNSNAALAKLLDIPVILVIDTRGTIRGVAPLLLGYQAFDKEIRIAGVILNQVGGARHESKLRAVVEEYTDIPVLGAVQHDPAMNIEERHLGLMPSNESGEAEAQINAIARKVSKQVDLDRLLACTRSPKARAMLAPAQPAGPVRFRIGLAQDRAFGFYYADDLDALKAGGAEIVPIDTLQDAHLPDQLDGMVIGGGFPEMFMSELEANSQLRQDIHQAIDTGLPVYAECGGLMYLARSMQWKDRAYQMVGAIPGDVHMHDKPMGRGYVRLKETGRGPWLESPVDDIAAHEFHYSSLDNLPADLTYAYEVKRGQGVDGQHDGIVHKNLLASYTHLRSTRNFSWVQRFLSLVARHASSQPNGRKHAA